jgi:hypothetical protein
MLATERFDRVVACVAQPWDGRLQTPGGPTPLE